MSFFVSQALERLTAHIIIIAGTALSRPLLDPTMLSTFDVNPRWGREAEAAAEQEQQQQAPPNDGSRPDSTPTSSSSHRMDRRAGGGNPHEDMIDVPGAHGPPSPPSDAAPNRSSSSSLLSPGRPPRRGSWCIDVPLMEGDPDHGGVIPRVDDHRRQTSHPPGRTEASDPDPSVGSTSVRSSASNSAAGGVTASDKSDIYERARKNLFGSSGGGLSGTGSSSNGDDGSRRSSRKSDGGDAWDLSAGPSWGAGGGGGRSVGSHESASYQRSPAHPPSHDQDQASAASAAVLPAWVKDKLRKVRLRREESSSSHLSNNSGSSSNVPQRTDYTKPLSTGTSTISRSNSAEDIGAPSIGNRIRHNSSDEQLARRERRSQSAWGGRNQSGKAAKRRASEGDIANDDGDVADGDIHSRAIRNSRKSFADRLEDLYDELDDETGQVPSAMPLESDLEAGTAGRSCDVGQLGHSGRFAARRAPTRPGSNSNFQDVDFDASGTFNDAFGGKVPLRHDPNTVSSSANDKGSLSGAISNHNSSSSRSSRRYDINRSQRSLRILFNSDGDCHLESTKNQSSSALGDFDFNPLDYKDYTSNVVRIERQRRINWCRVATVVMAACTVVLAAMTAYQKLGSPWSSNSPPSSSTTGHIWLDDASNSRADWAADWDALSSVKLPNHIESNLADWTSFAQAVERQRRDQYYKVQRMNDEIPGEEQQSTPLQWTIPFSGSTVTEEVFGQCLHLVQTSDLGVSNGHDSDGSLLVQQIRGHSYVNVDTTTDAGIKHAKELDLVESGISDVISTPLLHDAIRRLFDASHQGRAFVVLRNPVDRAMATYHYLTTGRFHGPDGETLNQLTTKTLQEYAESEFCDDNWLTRTLVNKPEGKLGKSDLNLAKAILQRKAIIGLFSDLANSIRHFTVVFGWDAPSSWEDCATDLIDRAYAREQEGFPRLDTDEPAFEVIQNKNKFDLELYDFAVQLRHQQLNA